MSCKFNLKCKILKNKMKWKYSMANIQRENTDHSKIYKYIHTHS